MDIEASGMRMLGVARAELADWKQAHVGCSYSREHKQEIEDMVASLRTDMVRAIDERVISELRKMKLMTAPEQGKTEWKRAGYDKESNLTNQTGWQDYWPESKGYKAPHTDHTHVDVTSLPDARFLPEGKTLEDVVREAMIEDTLEKPDPRPQAALLAERKRRKKKR